MDRTGESIISQYKAVIVPNGANRKAEEMKKYTSKYNTPLK